MSGRGFRGGGRGAPRGAARGRGRGRGRGAPAGRGAGAGRGGRGERGRGRGGRGGFTPRPPRGMIPKAALPEKLERIKNDTPDLPQYEQLKPSQVQDLKARLLNTVSAALIREPRYAGKNSIANRVMDLVVRVAFFDPEFVLKLAVYVRDELNIRSTACLILALASSLRPCQPFVRKYFKAAVRLPSDWLDVAATYRSLPHRPLQGKSLPACLRKAMIDKFRDFDVYQLGKYNKERTVKRKARRKRDFEEQWPEHVFEPEAKPTLTLKAMIRQLHIAKPVEPVMSLIGKKYPSTHEEFQRSGLRGEFDRMRAGKRMKLPIPETWETLVSEKGNCAATWETLIEHKKLPFMAMLRNIRNMILTGVKPRYHRWVQNKLMNEQTIAGSRQFPFSFFSAFEVIPRDLEHFQEMLDAANGIDNKHRPENAKLRFKPACMPDKGLFDRYRQALDESVKIATKHNVEPITGSTAVFVNISDVMKGDCAGARNMGGKASALDEIGVLLALMCRHACEDCELMVFAGKPKTNNDQSYVSVPRLDGAILNNIHPVLANRSKLPKTKSGEQFFPIDFVENCIRDHRHIDNLLVLSHEPISGQSVRGASGHTLGSMLAKYRADVNPDLLFVSVDLSSRGGGVSDGSAQKGDPNGPHPNDVQIAGFSDAILRFIAQRGDATQLQHVENIDRAKGLTPKDAVDAPPISSVLAATYNSAAEDDPEVGKRAKADVLIDDEDDEDDEHDEGAWREARIFLSSTFIDMHGERDILTRVVFPELRRRARDRRVRVREIDLRWGVTAEEAASGSTLGTCLREIDRCRPFFVGMLGHRYGWRPESYTNSLTDTDLDEDGALAWLHHYPAGRSVTELEMQHGALRNPEAARAFFYIRDQRFMHDVPDAHHGSFAPRDREAFDRIESLKNEIRAAHQSYPHRVALLDQYRCAFDKKSLEVVQPPPPKGSGLLSPSVHTPTAAAPMPRVHQLDQMAQHLLEHLWNAIDAEFPKLGPTLTLSPAGMAELEERRAHRMALETLGSTLIGRSKELERVRRFARGTVDSELLVSGAPGTGKSAILASWTATQRRAKALPVKPVLGLALPPLEVLVLYHFVGVTDRSRDVRALVRRMCAELLVQLPNLELPQPESSKETVSVEDDEDDNDSEPQSKQLAAVDVLTRENHLPTEWSDLQDCFASLLQQASIIARVFVVIDGIDRLREDDGSRASQLDWLPRSSGCKVLLSATPGSKAHDAAEARQARMLEVGPLEQGARERLVKTTLAAHSKKLAGHAMNDQMRVLVRKSDAASPLYLLIACEELRVFGVYERLSERIGRMAAHTPQLLDEVLERVENDQPHPQLARHALAALALARDGLTERELCGALDMPLAYWAPLRNALGSYLANVHSSDAPLRFFHVALQRAVCKRYGLPMVEAFEASSSGKSSRSRFGGARYATTSFGGGGSVSVDTATVHGMLADYFGRKDTARAARELPFHLLGAQRLDEVQTLLTDIAFVERKCAAGAVADLLDDYTRTRAALGGSRKTSSFSSSFRMNRMARSRNTTEVVKSPSLALKEMATWLRSALHVLVNEPELTFQLAANAPRSSTPHIAAAKRWKLAHDVVSGDVAAGKVAPVSTWLRWLNAPQSVPPLRGSVPLPTTALAIAVHTGAGAARFSSATSSYSSSQNSSQNTDDALLPAGGSALIAVALRDCSVRVYAGDSGAELSVLEGHTDWSVALAFSPDGSALVSGSWDKTVKVFDVALGQCEATLKGHRRRVSGVAYSNDGRNMASSGADCCMNLWDQYETRPVKKYSTDAPVSDLAFSPDDNQIVGALWNGRLVVFDVHEAKALRTIDVSSASLQRVSWRTNGRHFAAVDARGGLHLVAARSGSNAGSAPRLHEIRCTTVAYDGVGGDGLGGGSMFDGGSDVDARRLVLSSAADGEVSVCAAASGIQAWRWPDLSGVTDESPDENLAPACIATSVDGSTTVVGSDSGLVYLFDNAAQEVGVTLHRYDRPVTAVAISPNDQFVASTTGGGVVHLYKIKGAQLLHTFTEGEGSVGHKLEFSSNSNKLTLASDACAAFVFDVSSRALLYRLKHDMPVRAIAHMSNGRLIATGSNDGFVHLWTENNGQKVCSFPAHRDWLSDVAFAPDNKRVATASSDNTICIWNVRSQEQLAECKGHTGGITAIQFATDNAIASASADGTVRLFCANSGAQLTAVAAHHNEPLTSLGLLSANKDGIAVLTAGRDLSICATNLLKLNQLISVRHGRDTRAAFVTTGGGDYNSSRGAVPETIVASCARSDAYVRLWRVPAAGQSDSVNAEEKAAAQDQQRIRVHQGRVHAVAASPDGQRVATSGADGDICVIPLVANGGSALRFQHDRSGQQCGVRAMAWWSDSSLLATAGDDGLVRVWSFQGRKGVKVFATHAPVANAMSHKRHPLTSVCFGANKNTVIAGGWSGELFMCTSNNKVYKLQLDDWITSISVGNKGKLAVCALRNGSVILANVGSAGAPRIFSQLKLPIGDFARGVALAESGSHFVMACESGRVLTQAIANVANGQLNFEPMKLGTHEGSASACALSPAGSRALSVGVNGRLCLWSVRRGRRLAAFDRFAVPMSAVSAAGNGGALCVGDEHGGVSLLAVMTPP